MFNEILIKFEKKKIKIAVNEFAGKLLETADVI